MPVLRRPASALLRKRDRARVCPPWALAHGITIAQWSAANKRMRDSWRRASNASQQTRRRTRSRSTPPWAAENGITDEQWCEASPQQLKLWRYRHRLARAIPASGDDEDVPDLVEADDLHLLVAPDDRIYAREYCIADLDL